MDFSKSYDQIRHDKKLSPFSRLLITDILNLCNGRGYAWANNSHYADMYGVSPKTITRSISELEDAGHILIKYEGTHRHIYPNKVDKIVQGVDKIVPPMDKTVSGGMDKNVPIDGQNCPTPMDKNVPHNKLIESTNNNQLSISSKGDKSPTQKNEEVEEVEAFDIFDDIEADQKEKSFAQKEKKPFLVRDNPPTIEEVERQMQYAAENLGKSGNWYSLAEDFHHWYSDLDWSHNGTPFKSWDGRAYSWVKYPSKQKRKNDKPKGMSVSNRYSELLKEMNKNK